MDVDTPAVADDVAVLARLERIDALDRRGASPAELLPELRGLLSYAERWSLGAASGEWESEREVVGRLRTALQRT